MPPGVRQVSDTGQTPRVVPRRFISAGRCDCPGPWRRERGPSGRPSPVGADHHVCLPLLRGL